MYVTNYSAARGIDTELIDKVSAIVSLTNEIVDAYNASYGKIYVTNLKANSVYFVSTSRNEIMASIPVGAAPSAIAYDSENDKIDVTNSTLAPSRGIISVINGSTDNVIDNIHVGVGPTESPIILTMGKYT